jgi:HEPN superfamily protein
MSHGIPNCGACHKPMKHALGRLYYCENSQDRLHVNAYCDLLVKEGIDGRQDQDAVDRTCHLTDLALELGRKDSLACVLAWYETLEKKSFRGELAIRLDFSRANAIAGRRYGTKWQWEQATLSREIFYLRRAVSHPEFAQTPIDLRCMCLNNLGRRLRVAGRAIEALECWRRTLELQPNFGMALCNRAIILANYAEALEHTEEKALFWWVAHKEASAALAPTAVYTNVRRDETTRRVTKALKDWIESVLPVGEIAATGLDPLTGEDASVEEGEREYRYWCLVNCLFLNPLNDLGPYNVASTDSTALAAHVIPVDAPHIFESFFDQMKQEYVSARWLLYEGLTLKMPHFADRNVLLAATEPRPSLSLAIEKVKAAYRISYSLFDKVGFFMNAYVKLGIPAKQVSFRTLWRAGENQPIRKEFDLTGKDGNWGFCALYWLGKDFFEKTNDEVAEPQARGLSDIRNHIERKYLRVTVAESPTVPPDDLAFMVSREQFEQKALHLLKLARSALIYLTIGVGFEERRRVGEPGRADEPVEELPPTPHLPDAEKI